MILKIDHKILLVSMVVDKIEMYNSKISYSNVQWSERIFD